MSLSPIQRLLRRVPAVRWCAMQYAIKERAKQSDARWLYRQSILVTIGNITIMWAGVERLLDELIAHWQHVGTDLSKDHPRGLKSKLTYLKSMQRDERLNDAVREFLRVTRIEAKRLGDERHDIIHGMVQHIPASTDWQTQRIIYEGPFARIQPRKFSNEDLMRISREISDFGHFLSPRIWILIGRDVKPFRNHDQIDDVLREFGDT